MNFGIQNGVMKMFDYETIDVEDDGVYLNTRIYGSDDHVITKKLILAKEVFIECYNKWIKEEKE